MNFHPYPFALRRAAFDVPPELCVLRGRVDEALLRRTSDGAAAGECPVAALIAAGEIGESFYYRTLAACFGLPFRSDWPELAPDIAILDALGSSTARLGEGEAETWLVAPQDDALRRFFAAPRAARAGFALTTPTHFAALLQFHGQTVIERAACEALPRLAPQLSAKRLAGRFVRIIIATVLSIIAAVWFVAPSILAVLLGVLFTAGLLFKVTVTARALEPDALATSPPLQDKDLPVYSVLVPLRDETDIVPQLLQALDRLDYPKAKLDVLLLIEPEDLATRAALAAQSLPPWLRVVFGPVGGRLRTKPRALNFGLLAARGSLLTVFDAEDRPERGQLRAAAARFANAPHSLACVQAVLAIDNGDEGWLPRCFAIEYAFLFDLLNVGLTRLGLPVPLGGTSNHFRVASLKAAGGWDAWNVTEDADLGLRLARLGYDVDSLASVTWEAAPQPLGVWMKQRRRWTKGWMQTLLVLLLDAPGVCRALGWRRSMALVLCLTNLLLGPLLYPLVFVEFIAEALLSRAPGAATATGLLMSCFYAAIFAFGLLSSFWCGEVALRRRPSAGRWPALVLLPAYQILVGLAGWISLVDLWRAPHHWHKTPHPRQAERSRRTVSGPLFAEALRPRLSVRHRA